MKLKSLLIVAGLLLAATVANAQTVALNPTGATFKASSDQLTTKIDGSLALTSYVLVATSGVGALPITLDLGKPTPDATNLISVTIPQLAGISSNLVYTAVVYSVGPDCVIGGNPSAVPPVAACKATTPSNPFGRATPIVPGAAGTPTIR